MVEDMVGAPMMERPGPVSHSLLICTASSQRLRHLEQVMANDDHLIELTRQAKEKMKEPSRG
jgi:hypothetical protein